MLKELTEDQKEAVKEKTEKEIVLTEKKCGYRMQFCNMRVLIKSRKL